MHLHIFPLNLCIWGKNTFYIMQNNLVKNNALIASLLLYPNNTFAL